MPKPGFGMDKKAVFDGNGSLRLKNTKRIIIFVMKAPVQFPFGCVSIMVRGVRLGIAFFFTVWLVCSSPSAWAVTYHVSMTGDDTLPGTELQPWRTLAKANAAAQPGDIITVGAGTWSETPTTARNGTAEKPIVWRGNGDTSIISSFVIRHDYIQLRSFQVTGTVTLGGQNSNVNGGKQTGLVANYILVEN